MYTLDWQGSHDMFHGPMKESVENALGIVTYTHDVLYTYQASPPHPLFVTIYGETHIGFQALLDAMGLKYSMFSTKIGSTDLVETKYMIFSERLDHFDDLIRAVYGKRTNEYKSIWGNDRNRFYRGSYENREVALKGLATAMGTFSGLTAAAAEVMAYHDDLKAARTAQHGFIGDYNTDSSDVIDAVNALILQQNRNLGFLRFFYSLGPDPQKKINSFFDLSKIMNHGHDKKYLKHIPAAGFVKICIHHTKPTDKFRILVDGTEDAYISSAIDNNTPGKTTDFKATAGVQYEKPSTQVLSDLTKTHIIATNSSLTTATHIVFEIIEE